jgi:fructose-1,6-bisphosphatase
MVLNHSFGDGTLSRENVTWPGDGDQVRTWIRGRQREWRTVLQQISDDDLRSAQRTRWPFRDRPFGDVVAWVNIELTKNAAEVGYARFLYAARAKHRTAKEEARTRTPRRRN